MKIIKIYISDGKKGKKLFGPAKGDNNEMKGKPNIKTFLL